MVVFPNSKINLGLSIREKRPDGYHNLETVFYPVPPKDILEIIPAPPGSGTTFSTGGLSIPCSAPDENLCLKAYSLLKKDFPLLPEINMHLHKIIPMGAGLGGGSADGAFSLKLLNERFQLGIDTPQLIQYALQLGSDCPFFILNKAAYACGRGEKLQAIELSLSGLYFVLVNPGIHINTGWAFSQLIPSRQASPILSILQSPLESWKDNLRNDFETPVFSQYPAIAELKEKLYAAGAAYAAMTGSGSSVFGVFRKETRLRHLPENYLQQGYWL